MTVQEIRARLSFAGLTRPLLETGIAMDTWARAAAVILAPELKWIATVEESGDLGGSGRWGTAHIVKLEGKDRDDIVCGRGEARLVAGGDTKRVGGNGLITIETVCPTRYLSANNHCNVAHWDLFVAPVTDQQFDALKRALEEVLGQRADVGGDRREEIARGAQLLASGAAVDDAAVWIEDLQSVGIACRGHAMGEQLTVLVERADLGDMDDLDEARIVLGEVLSEAGIEEWDERSRQILVRLPSE